jgi:hypothetical protein
MWINEREGMDILVSVLLWLFTMLVVLFLRHRIQQWAIKGVEHHFNTKIEEVRSDFRKSEEAFKNDLQRKEKELDTLRSPATQMQVARGNTVAQKQIEAYTLLWESLYKKYPFKLAAQLLTNIDIDEVCKSESLKPAHVEVFSNLFNMAGLDKPEKLASDGYKARPFVSDSCWAKYAAYEAIGGYAVAVLAMFKSGLTKKSLLKEDELRKLVAVALPHQIPLLDKFGTAASFHLLGELEEAIITQIKLELKGDGVQETLSQTKKILEAADALNAQASSV